MKRLYAPLVAAITALLTAAMAMTAFASDVDVSVVDVTAPTGSVTLAPGGSGAITINMSVTGNQVGTATFEVYRDWTLSGGTFAGSNPQEFTVPPRAAQNPATTFSTTGTVSVAAGQADGTFTLAVGAFDITNSNATGAKLAARNASSYQVTVLTPAPPSNTPPSVSATGVTDGASYEIGSVPVAGCSVVDTEDGNSTFAATLSAITGPLSAYELGSQTASCSYTDGGGLSASASATYTIVDTTPPVITFVSRLPAPNGFGWNNADVTVEWTCSDAGSGVVTGSVSQTVSTEGADQSATGTCEDHAGNTASDTIGGINIDTTAPSVSLVGGPADGASYYFGFVPAAPTCTASDALAGLDGDCVVSGYSAAVGVHPVGASATDKAGNTASADATYTVLAWTLNGFHRPVDMDGVFNVVKGGSTVPLKFEIFAGPTELTDTAYVGSLTSAKVVCDGSAPTDVIEATATGGTSLRYDDIAGQFVFNWQTPKQPGQCYRVTMTTLDGSSLVAFFKLK